MREWNEIMKSSKGKGPIIIIQTIKFRLTYVSPCFLPPELFLPSPQLSQALAEKKMFLNEMLPWEERSHYFFWDRVSIRSHIFLLAFFLLNSFFLHLNCCRHWSISLCAVVLWRSARQVVVFCVVFHFFIPSSCLSALYPWLILFPYLRSCLSAFHSWLTLLPFLPSLCSPLPPSSEPIPQQLITSPTILTHLAIVVVVVICKALVFL